MKNKGLLIGIAFAAIVFAVIVIILTTQESTQDVVGIGCLLLLSSDAAKYGKSAQQGIELALHDVNSEGGVHGKSVQIIYEDTIADPKTGGSLKYRPLISSSICVLQLPP